MAITVKDFGTTSEGQKASLYTITNASGNSVSITDFGASIQSIIIKDKNGKSIDVVQGYDDVADYEANDGCLGATVGRIAGRISNAKFTLNSEEYPLYVNFADKHTLHSGKIGFHKRLFSAQVFEDQNMLAFTIFSPDMEEGFPGNLNLSVIFSYDDYDRLFINYLAKSDKDTILNVTNHSYFNLNGHNSGSVLDHELQILSDRFIETDENLIPSGKFLSVKDTPMDFTVPKKIGQDIHADYKPLIDNHGYDHAFVVDKQIESSEVRNVAILSSEQSGVKMYVTSSYPSVVCYTGNYLQDTKGKGGAVYPNHSAICLETQFLPDSINRPEFPSIIFKAGEMYNYTTSFEFESEYESALEEMDLF